MAYSIRAASCQHHIRYSNSLPWSGSLLDFDTPYCTSCANSRQIRQDVDSARRDYEHQQFCRSYHRGNAYRDSRRAYDGSRLAYQEDLDFQEDRDDREHRAAGRPTLREEARYAVGRDNPEFRELQRQLYALNGRGHRSARIEDSQSHRRASQYRDQDLYRRRSSGYQPGRYADQSG